jgi:predicted nucleotidyltransferase
MFIDCDPAAQCSPIDLAGITLMLEEHVPVDVDVTTRNCLHPSLKADIERSAMRVF